jgi:hypothetical protein
VVRAARGKSSSVRGVSSPLLKLRIPDFKIAAVDRAGKSNYFLETPWLPVWSVPFLIRQLSGYQGDYRTYSTDRWFAGCKIAVF